MAHNKLRLSLILFLAIFAYSNAELGYNHHLKVKETKMTIYFQEYLPGGANATVIQIPNQPSAAFEYAKFGSMFCTDDLLTEGFEDTSAQIGRGRGIYVTSALDGSYSTTLISIVFTNKKYNGSTLEIHGTSPQFEPVSEVAVVGGTGKFRLARGYATFETLHYDPIRVHAVLRCNLTVLHY